ncbi:hypothetical protein BPOR_0339g00110 [Botrytis porri]|uniref:Uncharacterized protein n=1 Tax=Botrytis porri TaxID=87229 RepID=A0A4Z1KJ08_9HELO|nr:hypothetical protein BPOR_0339g00110 [Botrytis porri]
MICLLTFNVINIESDLKGRVASVLLLKPITTFSLQIKKMINYFSHTPSLIFTERVLSWKELHLRKTEMWLCGMSFGFEARGVRNRYEELLMQGL